MANQNKVLVVDDEPFNREIMQEILESDYDVVYAESGDECLKKAAEERPGLILLDINMPGMSGYETCQYLKEDDGTKEIPVTFVSALDTLAERLAGYEVGGYDYITKPFEARELLTKVSVAFNIKETIDSYNANAKMAMDTAMTAMNNTGELGGVLNFLRQSFQCDDLEALAELIIETMNGYGLNSTIQLRVNSETINKTNADRVNPLECTVMSRIYQEDRIIDMGNRSIFNYEHVSILAKRMPVDDGDKLGRYKDHLALLAEGAEARIQAIMMQMSLQTKQRGLVKMVQSSRDALDHIAQNHEQLKLESIRILGDLIAKVEDAFSFIGLTETQEENMMEMINNAVKETIAVYENNSSVDDGLVTALSELKGVVENSDLR